MSLGPHLLDKAKRCFTYCGDDRCDCGAATGMIVADVIDAFRQDVRDILAEDRERRRASREAALKSKALIR